MIQGFPHRQTPSVPNVDGHAGGHPDPGIPIKSRPLGNHSLGSRKGRHRYPLPPGLKAPVCSKMDGGDDRLTVPKDGLKVFLHWYRQAPQLIDAEVPAAWRPRFQVPSHPPWWLAPATSSIEERTTAASTRQTR